jgi:N-methylhydantoinase A
VEILTWRVSVATAPEPIARAGDPARARPAVPADRRDVVDPATAEVQSCALYQREALRPGDWFAGPALVVERETTTVVSPAFDGVVNELGYLVLTRRAANPESAA